MQPDVPCAGDDALDRAHAPAMAATAEDEAATLRPPSLPGGAVSRT